MKLQIDIMDETNELSKDDIQFIENILHYAAEKESVEGASEVSVTFVTNEEIHRLNKAYRGKDQPTDVISFAMEELGQGEVEVLDLDIPRVLGDIIISIEKASDQAMEYNHSFRRELGFLTVHGFLHLLGYDHMTEQDEQRMFKRQKQILDGYGLER